MFVRITAASALAAAVPGAVHDGGILAAGDTRAGIAVKDPTAVLGPHGAVFAAEGLSRVAVQPLG